MKVETLIFVGTLGIIACCHPHEPVTPTPGGDGGAPPDAASRNPTCALFCGHMRELGCVQGKPTPKGASCEEVCLNVQQSEFAKLDLRCGYDARTCEAATACEN